MRTAPGPSRWCRSPAVADDRGSVAAQLGDFAMERLVEDLVAAEHGRCGGGVRVGALDAAEDREVLAGQHGLQDVPVLVPFASERFLVEPTALARRDEQAHLHA